MSNKITFRKIVHLKKNPNTWYDQDEFKFRHSTQSRATIKGNGKCTIVPLCFFTLKAFAYSTSCVVSKDSNLDSNLCTSRYNLCWDLPCFLLEANHADYIRGLCQTLSSAWTGRELFIAWTSHILPVDNW